ncbi:hypothetical protein ABT282_07840 [Streptomyces sp. NPDC000927]|uniref:hypothetical protein n=1 Tax=Streptomyces sp. NPDC000927 TaxID=3154371 RepID=UPI003321505B
MGIRIHKVLGYGLTNVRTVDGEIEDQRINPDSHFLTDSIPSHKYQDYLADLADAGDESAELELDLLDMAPSKEADTSHLCTWGKVSNAPHILLVQPVGFPRWRRHDDPIDYEQEVLREDHPSPNVTRTVSGIHPFSAQYMDVRTGEKLAGETVMTWHRFQEGKHSDEDLRQRILDKIAQGLGYKDHAEAESLIAPMVPEEVRRVCAWGQIFTKPEVCFELRPMIYTYWA